MALEKEEIQMLEATAPICTHCYKMLSIKTTPKMI